MNLKKSISILWLLYFLFALVNHYIGLMPFVTPRMEKIIWITSILSFPIFAVSLIKLLEKKEEKGVITVTERPFELVTPELGFSEEKIEDIGTLRKEYEQKILQLQRRVQELEEKLRYYEEQTKSVPTLQTIRTKTSEIVTSKVQEEDKEAILIDLKSEQLAIRELLTRLEEQYKARRITESTYKQMKQRYEGRLKEIDRKIKELEK